VTAAVHAVRRASKIGGPAADNLCKGEWLARAGAEGPDNPPGMDERPPTHLRAVPAPGDPAGRRSVPYPSGPQAPAPVPGAGAFCARCGRAPAAVARPVRVCARCGEGLVLVAAAGAAPRAGEAFVVVDPAGSLSALSTRAEALLGLDQPRAVGRAVVDHVHPLGDQPLMRHDFLATVRAAGRGIGPVRRFSATVIATGQAVGLRIAPCGPPPGALLVFAQPPG
jgi:hypothetical protein